MVEADKQRVALDVLKSLNAAVTTTKLYPPHLPQVAASEENAFAQISAFLQKYGTISFSLVEDEPKLCGLPVSQKTLGKRHGEDVFQQLKLLKLDHIVLKKDFKQKSFRQLLVFFTTSPKLVNKEGGGRSFVVNLGLNDYFPADYEVDLPVERDDSFGHAYSKLLEEQKVRTENIQSISTEIDAEVGAGQKRISILVGLKKEPGALENLLVASIGNALRGMHHSGSVFLPPAFGTILVNVDRITNEAERTELAKSTAVACLQYFDDFALYNLLMQNYPRGFGASLYDRLLSTMTSQFDRVAKLIKEEQAVIEKNYGQSSGQYRQIVAGFDRLLATDKGKQYLVREKAKRLLVDGEKERQAKRIQAGVSAILQGDVSRLRNKEVVSHIPAIIESLISRGKDKAAASIIEKITTELIKGDPANHDMLGESLGQISEHLLNTDKWRWLEKISVPLMAWVKETDKADSVFEDTIEILQKLQKYFWNNGKDEKADKILKLFFAIRTGKLQKSPEAVAIVGRIQDLFVEKAPLPQLLEQCVEEEDDLVDRRLLMQGPLAARFMLYTLFESNNADVRLKILQLLNRMGPLLPPLILEKLADPMPWHAKRNLIKLLADTGNEKDVPQVMDYLNHEDIRVQKEAFTCIYKLSGEDRKSNLLEALAISSGPMKEQVVRALVPMVDKEIVEEILAVLEDWSHFPEEVVDSLLTQIFTLLSKVPYKNAEEAVEEFLLHEGKSKTKHIGADVWHAAKNCQRQIKIIQRELSKKERSDSVVRMDMESHTVGEESSVQQDEKKTNTALSEEDHVKARLAEGDTDRARKLLVDLIEKAAHAKKFAEAERLRSWLIEIDPSALNDIIRTAEIIENFKSEGISSDYLQVWSRLSDNLSTEEFNALFYAMEHVTYKEEEILVRQGEVRPVLFFVNQGKVKIYYNDKSTEVFVKNIMQGEVFGHDTFFDASVWTISAAALSKAEVSVLPLGNIKSWSTEHPALESKLHDFIKKHQNLGVAIKDLNRTRREYKRYQITGSVTANILEKDGKDTGVQMKGEVSDLSRGGLSFLVRISHKKNARILLGRNIRVLLPSSTARSKVLTVDGVLMTVRSLYSMNNEYSAHVKLTHLLTEQELNSVVEAGRSESAEL